MPLVFSKSLVWVLSTLLWPGSPQRERKNCCGHRTLMHFACVVGKSVSDSIPRCAGVADSTVVLWLRLQFVGCASWTVGAVPDLESAWHGCGVKTNRTKTAPMDISNIGCWLTFWHSVWHSDRLDPSPLNPISLRVSHVSLPLGVFFSFGSLRWGLDLREFEPVTLLGGWVDGSEERTCMSLCDFSRERLSAGFFQ